MTHRSGRERERKLIRIRDASTEDVTSIQQLIAPFVKLELLLPRTDEEILALTKSGFSAVVDESLVGFAAVEVYSKKLAEIQCLAVSADHHGQGVGRLLVQKCVEFAREMKVKELMAISASDEFLKQCGFDYSLPNQKRALFYWPT